MKYLKLFEAYTKDRKEFIASVIKGIKNRQSSEEKSLRDNSIYELVNQLPLSGFCKVDLEEGISLQKALVEMGYSNFESMHPEFDSQEGTRTSDKKYKGVIKPRWTHISFVKDHNPDDDIWQEYYIVWDQNKKMIELTHSDFKGRDLTIKDSSLFSSSPKQTQYTTIQFKDYFKLKHEFRGHKLKKFGV